MFQLCPDKVLVTQKRPEDHDALVCGFPSTPPHCGDLDQMCELLCLERRNQQSDCQTDSAPASSHHECESLRVATTQMADTPTGEVMMYTSSKCAKISSFLQSCLGSTQSVVLAQGEEHGHQRVALLATFSLIDVKDFACVVLPQVAGWNERMELLTERRHAILAALLPETPDRNPQYHPTTRLLHQDSSPSELVVRGQCTRNQLWSKMHAGMEKWHGANCSENCRSGEQCIDGAGAGTQTILKKSCPSSCIGPTRRVVNKAGSQRRRSRH